MTQTSYVNLAGFVGVIMGLVSAVMNGLASAIDDVIANPADILALTKGIFAVSNDTNGAGLIYWIKDDIIYLLSNLGGPIASFLDAAGVSITTFLGLLF